MTRTFGDDPSQSPQRDLTAYIDRQAKTVKSVAGELLWGYGRGVVTVNTPRGQGAAGFLAKARRIELGNVAIECGNEFASVLVVRMDEGPLATARKVLIQMVTEEQPYGFKVENGTITDLGGSPYRRRRSRRGWRWRWRATALGPAPAETMHADRQSPVRQATSRRGSGPHGDGSKYVSLPLS